ncbi:MAG TPA: outer membrane beta-barrel protein [Gemmatimonadales bacterium]|nr:outer membrane beta-barrel protein [Gemmatimonadales bacterium]
MRRYIGRLARVLVLAATLVAPARLQAQGGGSAAVDTGARKTDTTRQADTPAAPINHLETTLAGFKLTGFAEGSYAYSGRSLGDTAIVGRLYDRLQNRFALNALAVVLDRPYDPAKFSAGFHTEVLLGQDATVIQSTGFKLGDQGDIPHLYVTLNVPTASGNGLQFKIGRIPTLLGLEVIETYANPNWSEGNQFVYVENFTGTGLSVETKFNDHVDAQFRVINGWDQVSDVNSHKSLMARVGIYPDALTSLGIVGYWGPEEPGNNTANRYGVDALLWRKFGKAAAWLQADYGTELANAALPDPTQDAKWWALGAWFAYDFTSTIGLALRGDYVKDENGARTSGVLGFLPNTGQKFGSGTVTLNVRSWPNAIVRPELRYDRSTLATFNGRKDQVSVALGVAYLY